MSETDETKETDNLAHSQSMKINILRGFTFRKPRTGKASTSTKLVALSKNIVDTKLIHVKIKSDFNILHIHARIIKKLSVHLDTKGISDQIAECEKQLIVPMSIVDKMFIRSRLNDLREEIVHIRENVSLQEYIFRTRKYVDAYKKMGALSISFCENTSVSEVEQPIASDRLDIILSYLEIAKNYHNIEISYEWGNKPRCSSCGSTDIDESSAGNIICYTCSAEDEVVLNLPMYRGGNNMSRGGKNDYDDRENFKKALKKFQGKQTPKFDKDTLFSNLDTYFAQRNLPLGEEIRTMPLDSRGRRGDTTKGKIQNALKKIKEPELYSEINLICSIYWGWEIPDISNLVEKMLADYDIFNSIYVTIRDKNKSSALNTEMTLYCLLRHNNFECNRGDFKIVCTTSIYRGYIQKMAMIFKIANEKHGGWIFDHSWW
uniref:Late transcription factor 3-like protein n=1 Tax=Pithovirus LCPAC406 TaxID=2506599 RepID=A0A481ZDM5_9VIRU|nr:MAG: late transcription factor 3-like protein [Pithovirus LCPAC406]